ncbi:MAG: hypothetical protein EB140_08520 [Proteobacteria bacterium]|nr:hypothetical protein [Pseudomonadota bacterium]
MGLCLPDRLPSNGPAVTAPPRRDLVFAPNDQAPGGWSLGFTGSGWLPSSMAHLPGFGMTDAQGAERHPGTET